MRVFLSLCCVLAVEGLSKRSQGSGWACVWNVGPGLLSISAHGTCVMKTSRAVRMCLCSRQQPVPFEVTVCLLRLSAYLEAIQVAGGLHTRLLKTLLQAGGGDRSLESWVYLEES